MRNNNLNPRFTFEQFACGSCNQFAFSSAYATAMNSGAVLNPLIIYGTYGLGKSHLLHAIGHQAITSNPAKRVICCAADSFMQSFIECLRTNQMHDFRSFFYSADLLLIDDLQRLAGKERTQQEFLYVYDKLVARQVQIVLTFDQHPLKLEGWTEALYSRFSGGLPVEVSLPDYETKRAIIEKLMIRHQISFAGDVANFIANIHTKCIRELDGIVIRLGTYSALQNLEVTLSMAMQYLQDMTNNAPDIGAQAQ